MIDILIFAVIFFGAAWGAYWIITHFFPEPIRMFALVITGIILLLVLLGALSGYIPNDILRLPR